MQRKISAVLLAALLMTLLAACSAIPITPADENLDNNLGNSDALLPHKLYYLCRSGGGKC